MPASYADYPSPDLMAVASAYGATGYRIENPAQLDQLPGALSHDVGLVIVGLHINGDYLNPASRDIAQHLG